MSPRVSRCAIRQSSPAMYCAQRACPRARALRANVCACCLPSVFVAGFFAQMCGPARGAWQPNASSFRLRAKSPGRDATRRNRAVVDTRASARRARALLARLRPIRRSTAHCSRANGRPPGPPPQGISMFNAERVLSLVPRDTCLRSAHAVTAVRRCRIDDKVRSSSPLSRNGSPMISPHPPAPTRRCPPPRSRARWWRRTRR